MRKFVRLAGTVLFVLIWLVLAAEPGAARSITLPLSIGFHHLSALVAYEAFPEPGRSATVLYQYGGCWLVRLSHPRFTPMGSDLRMEMQVFIQAATPLAGACLLPLSWQGRLAIIQRPAIVQPSGELMFRTVDSTLLTPDGRPAVVADALWGMAKPAVHEHLDAIRIDLSAPVGALKDFLPWVFSSQQRRRALDMARSLQPRAVAVTAQGLSIDLEAAIADRAPEPEPVPEPGADRAAALSEAERRRFMAVWETWDAFLVESLMSLADRPLTMEERTLLLDVLLETRHSLVALLQRPDVPEGFLRRQFARSWQRLGPILRKHLGGDPSADIVRYLSFFTAVDALTALDALGPELGVEITVDGLMRLARLISANSRLILQYDSGVKPDLRKVFGLEAPLQDSLAPVPHTPEGGGGGEAGTGRPPRRTSLGSLWERFGLAMASRAWASGGSGERIYDWVVNRRNIVDYGKRVRAVLRRSAANVTAGWDTAPAGADFYPRLVLSTAWQESCLRQFHIRKGKVVFLRSYSGVAVGLMQINERVWRGFYSLNKLRWDIRYNARAGCEILEIYLHRYALRRLEDPGALADDRLAGVVYAMYNGGPGQLTPFLRRSRQGKPWLSDRLFLEKYRWVEQGLWENLQRCL